MNEKELKIIANLDLNSRVTTKELGKALRTSQQSANYLLHKIEEEPFFLHYKTHIDSAKFGLLKVIVFYNYVNFKAKKSIIATLNHLDFISIIEECSQGYDLMVEFTVPNLSFFNKENKDILQKFKDSLVQREVYPVIVKHNYGRAYLDRTIVEKDIITAGDREVEDINILEKKFLKSIQSNARKSIIDISSEIGCDSKTTISIKKKLEKKRIIRKYGISINTPLVGISRIHILINANYENNEELDKLMELFKVNPNIIQVNKIIGNYEIMITIEKEKYDSKVFNKLREEFSIRDFKIIVSDNINKNRDIPNYALI